MEKITRRPMWIIAPDCRGHGDSGWVGTGGYYHFPDYVLDLDSLIRTLKVSSVVLMGHSMGGTISFLYSGTFPTRVKKLILVEGVGPPGFTFADAPARLGKWVAEVKASEQKKPVEYSSLEQMAQRLQRRDPRLKSTMDRNRRVMENGRGNLIPYTGPSPPNRFTRVRLWNFYAASSVRCSWFAGRRVIKCTERI
jgi:pimeloyl-ACP methyl ester carboxylesterase